ncbi:MAG: DNA-protecting protein DprA [Terrimonas ferruginea]|uniref:DNA-processing protein DprA n=1 Tax=Terrimonas ferruginea TaxID=249 RepID=UPI00092C4EEC|nr:DNA-processing protein DprA [Terrimonas ferruginea]MBN8783024.1 DNA-protecting protein DprA [Terrimonas ferruginea]OJW44203.1 MAG: DNA transporter [Sphingobacteriales bacterium 48-107]
MTNEAAYWIALAHLPKWGHLKINNLIIKFFHENQISIIDFFSLSENDWRKTYLLDDKQVADLKQAKVELASNAFLAESFLSQGYEIIPITSPEYSKTLKKNLKTAHAPAVLYVKGNKKILEEQSIAIVGSRAASEKSLAFTDNIAKKASIDYKVVVSGFAKGVDKQALDSAIKYKGQSVIVLPQGIMTFASGFKTYYSQIINGDVLVVSTFFPKAPWKTELAMARNPIIYGLADEIYVAESSEKGGTWSGVIDGLRKGRKIYVRKPEATEKNANDILIDKGAVPVDFNGREIAKAYQVLESQPVSVVEEPEESASLDAKIRLAIDGRALTAKELLTKLALDWTVQKLNNYLKKLDFIEIVKEKKTNQYKLKGSKAPTQSILFT